MQKLSKICSLLLVAAVAACGSTPPAPQHTERSEDWQVVVSGEGRHRLCYAGATPKGSEGTLALRSGKPYLTATRRNSGKIEFSVSSGYTYMPGSKVELVVDDDIYDLFHEKTVAWARSDQDDKELIKAISDADEIEVRGVSVARKTSIDHYSSDGFEGAIARIRELCP